MHATRRRDELAKGNRFLDPLNDIVTRAPCVVAKVVFEAELRHATSLQKRDHLVGRPCTVGEG